MTAASARDACNDRAGRMRLVQLQLCAARESKGMRCFAN